MSCSTKLEACLRNFIGSPLTDAHTTWLHAAVLAPFQQLLSSSCGGPAAVEDCCVQLVTQLCRISTDRDQLLSTRVVSPTELVKRASFVRSNFLGHMNTCSNEVPTAAQRALAVAFRPLPTFSTLILVGVFRHVEDGEASTCCLCDDRSQVPCEMLGPLNPNLVSQAAPIFMPAWTFVPRHPQCYIEILEAPLALKRYKAEVLFQITTTFPASSPQVLHKEFKLSRESLSTSAISLVGQVIAIGSVFPSSTGTMNCLVELQSGRSTGQRHTARVILRGLQAIRSRVYLRVGLVVGISDVSVTAVVESTGQRNILFQTNAGSCIVPWEYARCPTFLFQPAIPDPPDKIIPTELINYKGTITSTGDGYLELDFKYRLYTVHFKMVNEGRGLRCGAVVVINNAHLLYNSTGDMAFGLCHKSSVSLSRFSLLDAQVTRHHNRGPLTVYGKLFPFPAILALDEACDRFAHKFGSMPKSTVWGLNSRMNGVSTECLFGSLLCRLGMQSLQATNPLAAFLHHDDMGCNLGMPIDGIPDDAFDSLLTVSIKEICHLPEVTAARQHVLGNMSWNSFAVSSTSIRNSYLVGKIVASPATEFFPPHLKIQDDTGDLPIVISGVSPNCVDRVCGIKDYFVIIERIETDSPELLYIQCTVDALEELDSDTKAVQHRLGLERNTIENPRAYLFMCTEVKVSTQNAVAGGFWWSDSRANPVSTCLEFDVSSPIIASLSVGHVFVVTGVKTLQNTLLATGSCTMVEVVVRDSASAMVLPATPTKFAHQIDLQLLLPLSTGDLPIPHKSIQAIRKDNSLGTSSFAGFIVDKQYLSGNAFESLKRTAKANEGKLKVTVRDPQTADQVDVYWALSLCKYPLGFLLGAKIVIYGAEPQYSRSGNIYFETTKTSGYTLLITTPQQGASLQAKHSLMLAPEDYRTMRLPKRFICDFASTISAGLLDRSLYRVDVTILSTKVLTVTWHCRNCPGQCNDALHGEISCDLTCNVEDGTGVAQAKIGQPGLVWPLLRLTESQQASLIESAKSHGRIWFSRTRQSKSHNDLKEDLVSTRLAATKDQRLTLYAKLYVRNNADSARQHRAWQNTTTAACDDILLDVASWHPIDVIGDASALIHTL